MKKFYLLFSAFMAVFSMSAKQIDVNSAQKVAATFLKGGSTLRSGSDISLKPVHTEKENTALRSGGSQDAYYHVFNVGSDNGYIIISADDVNVPVIGYSDQGSYDPGNLPPAFSWWMGSVKEATKAGIEAKAEASEETTRQWSDYLSGKAPVQTRAATSVDPLIQTQWGQRDPYNSMISFKVDNNTKTPITGCVATAMAQVMKYYNHPRSGDGKIPTYTTNTLKIKVPEVDLVKSTYDWGNMSDTYGSSSTQDQKKAVGLLMWHAGAAVQMNYTAGESTATLTNACNAFKNYFAYDQGTAYRTKGGMSSYDWKNLIKEELTAKRPVLYAGYNNGGHAFVCDGYDANGGFHMNWGWGGYLDGYFNIDALKVGTSDFSLRHEIVYKIKPIFKSSFPTGLAVSVKTNKSADFKWNTVYGATSYTIEYRPVTTPESKWITAATNFTGTSYPLKGLTPHTLYNWRVRANSKSVSSGYSNGTNFRNTPMPTGPAVSIKAMNSADLKWNAVTGATDYTIQYKIDGTNTWTQITSVTGTSHTLQKLTLNALYNWKVRANFKTGSSTVNSDFVNGTNFTTLKATRMVVGIDVADNNDAGVSIYPNPAKDILNIKSDAVINKVSMYDASGKTVFNDAKAESAKAISVSHLPKGTYILKVETENGITTEKVIVK